MLTVEEANEKLNFTAHLFEIIKPEVIANTIFNNPVLFKEVFSKIVEKIKNSSEIETYIRLDEKDIIALESIIEKYWIGKKVYLQSPELPF